MINPKQLDLRVFEPKNTKIQDYYMRLCQFREFLAAFPALSFSYLSSIPKIKVFNCKTEGKMEAYIYPPLMFSESSLFGNLLVFEKLNIIQMGID